jgi:hypothetical protein
MPPDLSNATNDPADADIKAEWGPHTPWWRPGFLQSLRFIWWILLPVVLIGSIPMLLAFVPGDPAAHHMAIIGALKIVMMILILPYLLSGYVFSRVTKSREEPFCIHCGHTLTGLPDHHRCPECGRRFSFALVDAYRRDPDGFVNQWKQSLKGTRPEPIINDRSKR